MDNHSSEQVHLRALIRPEAGKSFPGNKISFALGLAAGIIFMLVWIVGYNAYDRQVRWGGGMNPDSKVREIYALLNRHSIMPFDKAEMLESMYRGFLAGVGDPYTQYFDMEALQAFHVRTEGQFVGIGVRVVVDPESRAVTLVNVFRGSPAAEAGLVPGDKIFSVNGIDVIGRPSSEVVGMITGPEGTDVKLTMFRPYENKRFDVYITRQVVEVPTVFHEMLDTETGRTGYIRIEGFERPTLSQFENALECLIECGMDSLILDVRNNPGGLLDVVGRITNRLIPEGIVTYTEDVNGNRHYLRSDQEHLGLPLVVLVNELSASASEVLGGAIQDTGMGILIGEQTFGKGIVQNLLYLSDETAIKLTVSKYFTPNGTSIHGIGIIPDIVVGMEESLIRRIGDLTIYEDVQLQAAIEAIYSKIR